MKIAPSSYLVYGFSLVLALLIIQFAYGLSILLPENVNWLMSVHHDWGQHYLGWAFYREDPWTFPLGNTSSLNYPIGTNVGFTDSIPLLALIFKPFSFLMSEDFQFFGLWLFICHFLTAVYTFKIFNLYKVNIWLIFLGVILVAANPVLLFRVIHPALSSHFLIVASIYNYLRASEHNANRINIHQVILFFIAGTINPYISVMIFGFNIVLPLKHYLIDKSITLKKLLLYPVLSITLVMIFWLIFGMVELNNRTNLASVEKFNYYSFNLNSFFNSYGYYSKFIPDLGSTDPRQYEGFGYLGFGMILIIFCTSIYAGILLYQKKLGRKNLKKYSLLLLLCLGYTVFAITNELTFGKVTFLELPSIKIIEKLGFIFRASGRFVWPFYYLLFIYSLILFSKMKWNMTVKTIVLVLLTGLQLYDTQKLFDQKDFVSGSYNTPLTDEKWITLMKKFDNIIIFPPFNFNYSMTYEMDYQDLCYLALKAKKPISNFYVARANVKKGEDFRMELLQKLNKGQIDDNRLFITTPENIASFDVLIKKNLIAINKMDNFIFIYSNKVKVNPSNFENNEATRKYIDSIQTFYKNQKTVRFTPAGFNLKDQNKISFNFDTFEFKDNILKIRGWGFLKETASNKGDTIFMALSDKKEMYIMPLKVDKRNDITTTYHKDLDDSGFNTVLFTETLAKNRYNVGLVIKDKNGQYNYAATEKTIVVR